MEVYKEEDSKIQGTCKSIMNIAYLIDYNLDDNNGVIQKIKEKALQWSQKGHTVYFVSFKTMTIYDIEQNILFQDNVMHIKLRGVGTALRLLYNSFFIHRLMKKIDIDLIYMRYMLYMPFLNKMLKKYKVIMEINSDDLLEYKLYSNVTHIYNLLTRDFFLHNIDAFVSVSHELKERFAKYKKPIEVIANGIDTSAYKIVNHNNSQPTLVFIGSFNQPWQGLDKVMKMAKYFKEYQFYIIGTEGKNNNNIKYFGYLPTKESTEIIQKCDIGIGTLSLYKQGLNEASPLKTRQYFACGLPVIYAYEDTDLVEELDFILKLKNKENNLEYQKIESFVQRVFKDKIICLKARKLSEEVLDYSKKEEERLTFFSILMNNTKYNPKSSNK